MFQPVPPIVLVVCIVLIVLIVLFKHILFLLLLLPRTDCLTNLGMADPPNPPAGYYFNVYIHHPSEDNFSSGWGLGVGTDIFDMPYLTGPWLIAKQFLFKIQNYSFGLMTNPNFSLLQYRCLV